MFVTKLLLKNWRNFRSVDIKLRERVYIIGPNASGKSNLLDVFRFLRDIAMPDGGGLQKAVKDRGGLKKVRSLHARRDPDVSIEVELSEDIDSDPLWRYSLAFRGEGKGLQRVFLSKEKVVRLSDNIVLVDRPNAEDKKDDDRLTQTFLQQISANQEFRDVADFFAGTTYLHLVPQLLKYSDQLGGYRLEHDPFGQAFLERIARTRDSTRDSRLKKIESALQTCVPNMTNLKFVRDEVNGSPHLEAMYKHWRPDAGWQREDQFSDGTLRLLGIMWSLLEGDSLLLLEEPELSLNESIVQKIHPLIWKLQRTARYRRQVIITTHSPALLGNPSLNPKEVVWLEMSSDGTHVKAIDKKDAKLIKAGYSIADIVLPKMRPADLDQLDLF